MSNYTELVNLGKEVLQEIFETNEKLKRLEYKNLTAEERIERTKLVSNEKLLNAKLEAFEKVSTYVFEISSGTFRQRLSRP